MAPASVAFLLGVPRAPRTRPAVAEVSEVAPPAPEPPSGAQDGETRKFARPPWLVATSEDARARSDHFRVA